MGLKAGQYAKVEEAQKDMGQGFSMEYLPIPANVAMYAEFYKEYQKLGQITEETFYKSL